jgi:hypothetical protein
MVRVLEGLDYVANMKNGVYNVLIREKEFACNTYWHRYKVFELPQRTTTIDEHEGRHSFLQALSPCSNCL